MRIFWVAIIFINLHMTCVQGADHQYENNIYSIPKIDIIYYEVMDSKRSDRQHLIGKIHKEWQNSPSLLIKLIASNNYPLEKAIKFRKQLIYSGVNPYNISILKKNKISPNEKNNILFIKIEKTNKKINYCYYHKDDYRNHNNKSFGCAINSNINNSLI